LRLIKVDPPPAFSCVLFECACHIYGASSCSMRGDRRSRSTNQRVDEFLSVDEREICSLTELRGHGVRSILCESTQSAAPWSVCGCLTRALLRRILLPQSRRIARDCTSTSHRRCSEQTQLAFVTRFTSPRNTVRLILTFVILCLSRLLVFLSLALHLYQRS
jgi:hypothetical protein